MRALALVAGFALMTSACGSDGAPPVEPMDALSLRGVSSATPVLPGSRLYVTATGIDELSATVLRLTRNGHATELLPDLASTTTAFVFTQDALVDLQEGEGVATAVLIEGDRASGTLEVPLTVAASVPLSLATTPGGSVHRNDELILTGTGFVTADEGTMTAKFEGTFTPTGGSAAPVSTSLPVIIVEPRDRTRALLRLTTAIGGVKPGVFTGTLTMRTTFALAAPQSTAGTAVTLSFGKPEILNVSPTAASLQAVIGVTGNGFLGDVDSPDETTLMEFSGTFTPPDGLGIDVPPTDIVMTYVSGDTVTTVIDTEESGGRLISSLFGSARGHFEGTIKPIVIKGDTEVIGDDVPLSLTLGPVVQVVWLKFLPGFYVSLDKFGLTAAASKLEPLVEKRIESIYSPYPVDVRLTRPTDFGENGYVTLEIGGPDPNGLGLFGYDNTPGKDVGNLRLFDTIGGTNATTQEDGYPGYGGVFIESLFFFSSHPAVKLPNGGGPTSDPLFDDVFDGVRSKPATRAEVDGQGSDARVALVARALTAFTNMVGETAAHELGHSLGLANPYGPADAYHNAGDGEGCLMDNGSSRPVGERFAEEGFAKSRFCYDEPSYLDDIFGVTTSDIGE